jgi:hypothetical protein
VKWQHCPTLTQPRKVEKLGPQLGLVLSSLWRRRKNRLQPQMPHRAQQGTQQRTRTSWNSKHSLVKVACEQPANSLMLRVSRQRSSPDQHSAGLADQAACVCVMYASVQRAPAWTYPQQRTWYLKANRSVIIHLFTSRFINFSFYSTHSDGAG